jgi:putative peptidoglycan lipid II flippase
MGFFLSLFGKRQSSVRSATYVLMVMVLASRVFGLVRDRLLAARFSPDELGVYLAAFRLPNLLFELLVMGALTSAFIPVYTKLLHENKEKEAWQMSSAVINLCIGALFVISIPMLIWTEQISRLITPGFSEADIITMSAYTRFIIASQVIPLLVGNFFTGILQSYDIFLIPAAAPVIYNLGTIFGIVVLTPLYGLWAPVIGVGIGAALFMIIQIPSLIKIGFRYQLIWSAKIDGVKDVFRLMGPRTFGLAVSQIDSTTDLILASILGPRMVTIFNFAQHLQQLPIGLFGSTVAQAAFPILSRASAKNDHALFEETIVSTMNQVLFYTLPVSVLFIVLRTPIVRLVFGASQFDWDATVLTGMTLSAFSVSLFAQSAIQILTRAFYALYDSRTPVGVSITTILVNVGLSLFFIRVLGWSVWSLGVSTSVANILHVVILLFLLYRKQHGMDIFRMIHNPVRMVVASLVMSVVVYIPFKLFDQLVFDTTRTFGLILLLSAVSGIGLVTYLYFVWLFDVTEVKSVLALLERVKNLRSFFIEPVNEVVDNGNQDQPVS